MDKNEFDMDFDFEKEFGLNFDDLNDGAEQNFSVDFSDDDMEQLKLSGDDEFSFDFGSLDLDSEDSDDALGSDALTDDFTADFESDAEDDADAGDSFMDDLLGDMDDVDFLMGAHSVDDEDLFESDDETEAEESAEYAEEADYDEAAEDAEETDGQAVEDASDDSWNTPGNADVQINAPGLSSEEDAPEDEQEQPDRKPKRRKPALKLPFGKKKKRDRKANRRGETSEDTENMPPKPRKPSILSKVLELYLGPIKHRGEEPAEITDANGRVRRRRRKTKMQIFKEVYLPPLIALAGLMMILFFIVGSVTNAFKQKGINDEKNRRESVAASMAADEAQLAYQQAVAQADLLATNYDFNKAIELLDGIIASDPSHSEELIAKKAEYVKAQSNLVEWKDISQIPNLSFHVLIADPARAFANKELGGLYNRNFVTVDEFRRVLTELYANDYILVDFNTLVSTNANLDGKKSFFTGGLYLPQGKTPVMITETMVNYFEYMIDSNKDGVADAGGSGFASKLVLDNGEIKAQMVDASGNTVVGDYDLVPVLEAFIQEHPDFSFKGSRATLAVSGTEGIFGYRTNTSYITSRGQAFYEQEVAEARVLVDALKEKGYSLACYTYANVNYKSMTVAQIQADLQNWSSQIVPVMGETEILVYAREGDIDDYTGNKFTQLYNSGFRYFVTNGENPSTDVKETFIRQSRLMVTGNAMGWYSSRFAKYFDSNKVLDMTSRKSIPN